MHAMKGPSQELHALQHSAGCPLPVFPPAGWWKVPWHREPASSQAASLLEGRLPGPLAPGGVRGSCVPAPPAPQGCSSLSIAGHPKHIPSISGHPEHIPCVPTQAQRLQPSCCHVPELSLSSWTVAKSRALCEARWSGNGHTLSPPCAAPPWLGVPHKSKPGANQGYFQCFKLGKDHSTLYFSLRMGERPICTAVLSSSSQLHRRCGTCTEHLPGALGGNQLPLTMGQQPGPYQYSSQLLPP